MEERNPSFLEKARRRQAILHGMREETREMRQATRERAEFQLLGVKIGDSRERVRTLAAAPRQNESKPYEYRRSRLTN
jgi:hypothetical protein